MSENENNKIENDESLESEEEAQEKPRKPVRKTQAQMLQEVLGLEPGQIELIEKKLFLAKFIDYFSEETFDFIFKDKSIDQYKSEIIKTLEEFKEGREEDKLIKKSWESKQIFNIIDQLKIKGEELARREGINKSIDKRLRFLSLIVTLPFFAVIIVLSILPIDILFLFPILCVFCMLPTMLRGFIVKKWYAFKERHKNEFYTENRDDIMILKAYAGEVLNSTRSHLLELKVPLQIITFPLFSRDYENLELKNQYKSRQGTIQYSFNFAYPEGMEPFPIPDALLQRYTPPVKGEPAEKAEQNFILLSDLEVKDGVIIGFVPTLKDALANQINEMLNECEFGKATKKFEEIIPKYQSDLAIYCICGEIAQFESVQICTYKAKFKFYLFEGKECECGESIYAISLMDENSEVPSELADIFSS